MFLAIVLVLSYILSGFMTMFVYKWPREIKIMTKRKCPNSDINTKWYESIPILGFIITKGKYANQEKKSIDEITIPLVNMAAYLLIYFIYGEFIGSYLFMLFTSLMIILSFIDFRYYLIPDRVHILILIIGILAAIFNGVNLEQFGDSFDIALADRFIGAIVGFLPIYILGIIISRIKGTDALGGGDIKLLGAAGFFIGWQNILFAILLGSFIALFIEKILQAINLRDPEQPFAFGPYLALAMILSISLGPVCINWYLGLFA